MFFLPITPSDEQIAIGVLRLQGKRMVPDNLNRDVLREIVDRNLSRKHAGGGFWLNTDAGRKLVLKHIDAASAASY